MRRSLSLVVVLAASLLLVTACSSGGDDAADPRATSRAEEEVEDENAPAVQVTDLEDDGGEGDEMALVFSPRRLELDPNVGDGRSIVASIPDGWVAPNPAFPTLFGPADAVGFVAQFHVGVSCGGGCGPLTDAEWAERVEEVEFAQFRDAENFEIMREEEVTSGKLLVATNSFGNQSLTFVRWFDAQEEYFFCRFTQVRDAGFDLRAFEQACDAAAIDDLPTAATAPSAAPDDGNTGPKLAFEDHEFPRADSDASFTFPVPLGWPERIPGEFVHDYAPHKAQVHVLTIRAGCGDGCEPRSADAWADQLEEYEFQFLRNGEVLREEEVPGAKIIVTSRRFVPPFIGPTIRFSMGRWADGGSQYFWCSYATADPDVFPISIFEDLCANTDLSSLWAPPSAGG